MKTTRIITTLLLLAASFCAYAQNITVRGGVTDFATGEPVPAASVVVSGTTIGEIADINGNYSISAPSGATLVFSSIGYETQVVPIQGRTRIDVVLEQSAEALEDVLVVAYGTAKKSS